MGLLPSLEIVSLTAPTTCSLALTLHLSIRLPSVYSSCSPSPSSSFLFSPFTLSLSLFFSPFANSTNKCSAVLLIAFPVPLLFPRVPCSTTLLVISSRGLKLFGFFNLLIILLCFLSNRPRLLPYSRHHHLLSALSSNFALLGRGLCSILWILQLILIPRFLSLLSFRFNLIRLRLFLLNVVPIRF